MDANRRLHDCALLDAKCAVIAAVVGPPHPDEKIRAEADC
jgi:hypothetical protein